MMCHCGKPLHYTDPHLQKLVQGWVDELGEFMTVTTAGRSWKVQRHFIALHGLEAIKLSELGFEEVK